MQSFFLMPNAAKSKKASKKASKPKFAVTKSPQKLYGELYTSVQQKKIFHDEETFLNGETNGQKPKRVYQKYVNAKDHYDFSLRDFLSQNFVFPSFTFPKASPQMDPIAYAKGLIEPSKQRCEHDFGSQLPLPHPYLVSGSGVANDTPYWNSYFQMLALKKLQETELIRDTVKNYKHVLKTYGFIPIRNRSYAMNRSNPPVFALMVSLLAEIDGPATYGKCAEALQIEYDYFMDKSFDTHHVFIMNDGETLNRYWDRGDEPRDEAYSADSEFVSGFSDTEARFLLRELGTAVESGWGLSTRWLMSASDTKSVHATNYLPVDLNCLMYQLEATLSRAYKETGEKTKQDEMWLAAQKRRAAIEKYLYNERLHWYTDYIISQERSSPVKTLAGMFPFYLNIADGLRINDVAPVVESDFLLPGGLLTTLQQGGTWDCLYGWAPLQYVAIKGLDMYGKKDLARAAASRWIAKTKSHFSQYGRFAEKLNVLEAASAPASNNNSSRAHSNSNKAESWDSACPAEVGFGWAASVAVLLCSEYGY